MQTLALLCRLLAFYLVSPAFPVDFTHNYQRRQYLASMLLPDDPSQGRITFTLVKEPLPEEEGDCEDVGVAYLNVRDILHSGHDIVNQSVPGEQSKNLNRINLRVLRNRFCH
ncbi:unnamed protein product [Protopolystoma xenopodis]|uniref:RPGRIP1 C-terminal domain-containing protein n=1 Tax=Protopolystoma xenopodis TaxID=117903 RepID=A0A3S5BPP8_9PLAT|nr:unnamed protein product [Protopolystoma xenopodis]